VTAACPGAKRVVAGGYRLDPTLAGDVLIVGNAPAPDGRGWVVRALVRPDRPTPPEPWALSAEAVCASGETVVVVQRSPSGTEPAQTVVATCPPGLRPSGGGYQRQGSEADIVVVVNTATADGQGWVAHGEMRADTPELTVPWELTVAAICAGG